GKITESEDESPSEIAVKVSYETDLDGLTPEIIFIGESVSPTGPQDFTNPVTYTVRAPDGATRDYVVTVTKAGIDEKEITDFEIFADDAFDLLIVEGDIDNDENTITLRVPFGTDVKALTPTITYTGIHIDPKSGIEQDFSDPDDPVVYTVKSARPDPEPEPDPEIPTTTEEPTTDPETTEPEDPDPTDPTDPEPPEETTDPTEPPIEPDAPTEPETTESPTEPLTEPTGPTDTTEPEEEPIPPTEPTTNTRQYTVIVESIEAAGVTLNRSSAKVKLGNTLDLFATVNPAGANPEVTWESSDDEVATVEEMIDDDGVKVGVVTGIEKGTAIITVTSVENPELTAECEVIVTGDVIAPSSNREGVEINLTQETIELNNLRIMTYSVDGGTKWKKLGKKTFDDTLLRKLLNNKSGLKLRLATSEVPKKAKTPPADSIIIFPDIAKRADLPKFAINYSEEGNWFLSSKGSDTPLSQLIIVAPPSSNPKIPGEFSEFDLESTEVTPFSTTKTKNIQFVRVSPEDKGDSFAAGSKLKKITVKNESKPPSIKVSGGTAKIKKGMKVQIGDNVPTEYASAAKGVSVPPGTKIWVASTSKKPASGKYEVK
ncbi:MAG: Ig-like domain-containing protein, partial [Oscillospiraceae bacterium]|nr:Ig-like domain-containing protein [Oscillospiraceae bacterium]